MKIGKWAISTIVTMCVMCMVLNPMRVYADGVEPGDINIADYPDGIVINSENISEYSGKTITGNAGTKANLIIDGVEAELTIKDLTIDRAQEGSANYNCDAIYLRNGATLILTLEGNNRLVGNNSNGGAGIRVESDNTLVITENSSGALEAIGGNGQGGAAGIGSGNSGYDGTHVARNPVLGTIEICGGTITASGGLSYRMTEVVLGCAGIGCSGMGESGKGSITISGGNVTATGGSEGAGIGGATSCSPNKITISGGEIIANAGNNAAAIGSGYNGGFDTIGCGEISITGGNIIANGNIGYGHSYSDGTFAGGSVAIGGNAIVTVADGEITPGTDIEQGHVMQKYPLTLTVMNPSYISGTVAGHINVGVGENAFSQDITYILEDGKAVAAIEIETILYGEQTVNATIDGTELEEKALVIGTETGLVYGNEKRDYAVSVTDEVYCRYENGVLTISGNGSVTVSMSDGVELTSDSIFIDDEADISLTINRLSVDTTGKNRSPITIGSNTGAVCKLIPEGINTLKRCDSELAVGVIEVGENSTLTIGGYGTLNLQGKTGESNRGAYSKYAGGIRAINAEVIIEDNPALVISNPEGDKFSGILSEKITINGGKIDSRASDSGQGIGIPFDDSGDHDVIISGGTIYVEGGYSANWLGAITNDGCARAVISGGSVNMNKLSRTDHPDKFNNHQPVNAQGDLLYCTTITVGKANDNGNYTLSNNVKITDITVKDSTGSDYQYGIAGMYTDADAKIYLWLPAGAVVSKVETECGTYEGNCTANTSVTSNYKGNSFGTANAEFALAQGSEYQIILTGEGTKENPYKIVTFEELEKFRDLVNGGETEICGVLTANISAKDAEWTPIGTEEHPYQGTFDGNGKKITQLRIPAKESDYSNKGFFGLVQNAYIKNLSVSGTVGKDAITNRNAENYGMIAGKASNSTFEGCINRGSVFGGQNAAGICGWASGCTFKKCTNYGDGIIISSYKSVCGIVYDGDNSCTVENCASSMYSNSAFGKMDSSAVMSDCHTIGGKNRINCLSLAAKYDLYEFMEEDANYYGHKRSDDENYAGYKADGTKVTENWRDGKIAYLLQGNQKDLIWINRLGIYSNEWPQINYTSDDAHYRVYESKTYTKCDKSDTPALSYQNGRSEDFVPTHSFTKEDKTDNAVKTPGTCVDNTVYYYSCIHCGAVEKDDSHTFVGDVNPDNHVGMTEIRDAREAVHKTQTDGYTGDTYCLSCEALISNGTAITPTPHEPSDWKYDETHHWKLCTVENCGAEIAESVALHSSTGTNNATCQKAAVCDKCGAEYGEKIPCSFTAEVKSEAALKTPATETTGAVYYYSCSMCGSVEKNDMHTFADYREPETEPSSGDNTPPEGEADPEDNTPPEGEADPEDNTPPEGEADPEDNTPPEGEADSEDNTSSDSEQSPAENIEDTDNTDNASSSSETSLGENTLDMTSSETETTAKDDDNNLQGSQIDDEVIGDEIIDDEVIGDEVIGDEVIGDEVIDETSQNTENAANDNSGSSVTGATEETGTVIDKEKASDRHPVAATAVAVGLGVTGVGAGAFFFLKRKKILGKILKNIFK